MALERPVFWLGVAGLAPEQRAMLSASLPSQPTHRPAWRVARFEEADAWCVSGAVAYVQADGVLRVPDSRRVGSGLELALGRLHRPLAFTTPMLAAPVKPGLQVNLESRASVQAMLQQFETSLQPVQVQYGLGALVCRGVGRLLHAVYEVVDQSLLLAVVDLPRRRVDYWVDASLAQIEQASWEPRSATGTVLPSDFEQASLIQVMWQYAQHAPVLVLPAAYATERLRLRRWPQVPESWLKESQLRLLRALELGPISWPQLQQEGLNSAQLARDVASFYFDGAIAVASGDAPWLSSANVRLSDLAPLVAMDGH